jgi:hypothetical protein
MKKKWESFYDENGKVIKMIYGDNERILNFTYNKDGYKTSMTSTSKGWAKYEYDENNNCISIEEDGGFWKKAEFNSKGELLWEKNSNGGWIKREYKDLSNGITECYSTVSGGYWEITRYNDDYMFYLENSNKIIRDQPHKLYKPSLK